MAIRCVRAIYELSDGRNRVCFTDGTHMNQARVLASILVRRPLEAGEVVHHKNRDPSDNRLENLQVFGSQSEHTRHHHAAGDLDSTGIPSTPWKKRGIEMTAIHLRLERDLKEQLKESGKEQGRSLNSEIVYRLARSFNNYSH